MNCCPNCFDDDFLAKQINDLSQNIGDCDYCKVVNTTIINPILLSDYFYPLIDLYEISVDGDFLIDLFKKDWFIFTNIDSQISKTLVEHILEIQIDNKYINKNIDNSNILNWQEFKDELKHLNRYFPTKAPNYNYLNGVLQYLIVPSSAIPKYLYRARISKDNNIIDISSMGKPPEKISTAGRANPIGIPYLYTASNIKTTIAEIRPNKGDYVTVAKFEIVESLKLLDLRNPRKSISPFELGDDINTLDLGYLCHLGEELSKPVLPREADLEYLPSQYLCELIKHCGFDGVIYKSSVGDGDNFAIFYDEKLKGIETKLFLINNVEFEFNPK